MGAVAKSTEVIDDFSALAPKFLHVCYGIRNTCRWLSGNVHCQAARELRLRARRTADIRQAY
jgi:hypothetical protein